MAAVRPVVGIERDHRRFLLRDLSFTQQFSHVYFTRLGQLSPRVEEAAAGLGDVGQCARVLSLRPGQRALCVGTVYKNMAALTPFLREYTKELVRIDAGAEDDDEEPTLELEPSAADAVAADTAAVGVCCQATDSLVLEDESGRVELCGTASPLTSIVTGVVVGIVGTLLEKGKLEVEAVCFARTPSVPRPLPPAAAAPCYVAFLSGLDIGCNGFVGSAVELLVDYLCGHVPSTQAAAISRLIIGGNLIEMTDDTRLKHKIRLEPTDHAKSAAIGENNAATAMQFADHVLTQLAGSLDLELMPGEADPTNCFWPQQPVHPILLPAASRRSTVRFVTNPYECTLSAESASGIATTVTSGLNVADVLRQTALGSPCAAMEHMLRWGSLAPTAPNTLPCYPFKGEEPFLFRRLPHLMVACNQPAFDSQLTAGGTRLVAVPVFSETSQLVLVDLHSPTLEASVVTFA